MSDAKTEHDVEQQEPLPLDLSPAAIFIGVVIICLSVAIVASSFFPQMSGG